MRCRLQKMTCASMRNRLSECMRSYVQHDTRSKIRTQSNMFAGQLLTYTTSTGFDIINVQLSISTILLVRQL